VTLAVGVDVGATKIAAARVEVETGAIHAEQRVPTKPGRGPDAVLEDCVALARAVTAGAEIAGVGLAVCEIVDLAGNVRSAETLDWRSTDLAAAFAGVAPARVESDVRAAAIAEAMHGAGRDEVDFLYLSVGSGISHCLVVDGVPRGGVRGAAISTGAPLVEQWSSGLALARLSGHARAEDALADPAAEPVIADGARRLGVVLAGLVNALDPGVVVVGGGLGLHDGYRERVVAAMRPAVYDPEARELPVVPAVLGTVAGAIGAALVAAATAHGCSRGR
jgi:predicted NBD/HSP70 family sugar kinase